jgi:pseudouridine-5'-phosphate glycosidase
LTLPPRHRRRLRGDVPGGPRKELALLWRAAEVALWPEDLDGALRQVENEAEVAGVRGGALTPFLLKRLAEFTEGRTLHAHQALVANARLAAQVARRLAERGSC